jgi:hypothetical protein
MDVAVFLSERWIRIECRRRGYAHLQPGHLLRAVNAIDEKLNVRSNRQSTPANTK